MHFSHINDGSGTKATKIALVTGFHILLGLGLIQTMDTKMLSMPKVLDEITVMLPEAVKPPPPPEPPKPMPKVAPPDVVVPKVEVEIAPPPVDQQVQATVEADPTPATTPSQAQVQSDAPPAQPSANNGAMRSAVLADANGCAKPEYPVNAARNGDTGTVTLALLVGTDGKVTSSRVQKSSGSRELDKAAVNALSLCTFKPAMNGGTPEAGWAQLAYVWNLD